MKRRELLLSGLTCISSTAALAANHSTKNPILLIVPFSPGGLADNVARLLADALLELKGHQLIVINKPGASGVIAALDVANSQPTERKLMFTASTAALAIRQLKDERLNALRTLQPLSGVGRQDSFLVVSEQIKSRNLKDFIDLLRSGFASTYGSIGIGSVGHILGAAMIERLGSDISHVPYKVSSLMMQDIARGNPTFSFCAYDVFRPFMEKQLVKPIAIASAERSPLFPLVSTMREEGFKEVECQPWLAIYAPNHANDWLPTNIISDINETLSNPEIVLRLKSMNVEPFKLAGPKLNRFIDEDMRSWQSKWRRLSELGLLQ